MPVCCDMMLVKTVLPVTGATGGGAPPLSPRRHFLKCRVSWHHARLSVHPSAAFRGRRAEGGKLAPDEPIDTTRTADHALRPS